MTLECEETVCPWIGPDSLDDIHTFGHGAAPLPALPPAPAPDTFNALYQE